MHLHLDPVGGIAGDMFIAALLDAFPALAAGLDAVLARVGLPPGARCAVLAHHDGVLCGRRFELRLPAAAPGAQHQHGEHVGLVAIRAAIAAMDLEPAVAARAAAIFEILANAEARVHGIGMDAVEFHEVGALDSIADIVGAAWIVDALGPATWSVGALPLGSGRVQSAHGALPLPAPAVVELLTGFAFVDDGLPGERVTPTGAAILRHLNCASGMPRPGRLKASGLGFGSRKLPGLANVLRVLAFDGIDAPAAEEIAQLAFEVDDQTAEDLAQGLERLRALEGVLDVVQSPVYGKKGRMAAQVQVLAQPQRLAVIISACFTETTTLGVRHQLLARSVLARHETGVADAAGQTVRVKLARRPDGAMSAKAESEDLRAGGGRSGRENLRRASEAAALAQDAKRGK